MENEECGAVDEAVGEGSLENYLEKRICDQFPALRHCRSLYMGENRTVAGETREQVRAAQGEILRRLRAHFPQGRLRKQLKQNPALQARQRERERKQSDRKQLREALLKANQTLNKFYYFSGSDAICDIVGKNTYLWRFLLHI